MSEIKWSEKRFSVGVRELDDQHKQLIELINAIEGKSDPGTMFDTVLTMFNYAALHFKTEEKLLSKRDYPELDYQISEHKKFQAKATEFAGRDFRKPAACTQVASYLREWMIKHILEEDMKYKERLSKGAV